MNFLITGAAGFLGSALANRLAREGHQVRGLDDLSTGDPQALSPDVLFTRGDVNDRPKLWTLLQDVDCVYHLAARVLEKAYQVCAGGAFDACLGNLVFTGEVHGVSNVRIVSSSS